MTPLNNKGYIYKVTNIITGQFYIGQRSSYTGAPEDDLGVHYFTSSKVVRPLFKNNTSEWEKEILYRDIQYVETLNDMEGYAIHKVIKDPLCMNRYDPSLSSGFSTAGTHRSAEAIAKTSAALRGTHRAPLSEETRAKMSAAHRGKHLSGETRAKMSAAHLGKHRSEETRAKIGAAAKNCSEETRAKIAAARRGKHHSAEARAKMREAWKHRAPVSEETRAKLSYSAKNN